MESGWPFGASRATMPLQAIPSGSRVTDLDRSRIHLLITNGYFFKDSPPPPSRSLPSTPRKSAPLAISLVSGCNSSRSVSYCCFMMFFVCSCFWWYWFCCCLFWVPLGTALKPTSVHPELSGAVQELQFLWPFTPGWALWGRWPGAVSSVIVHWHVLSSGAVPWKSRWPSWAPRRP